MGQLFFGNPSMTFLSILLCQFFTKNVKKILLTWIPIVDFATSEFLNGQGSKERNILVSQ